MIQKTVNNDGKKTPCTSEGLKMLGDYWTLSLIQALRTGEKRFCQLQRDLGGLNPTTLTNRLKKLEHAHIIRRQMETVDKLSVTYALTEKGTAILPIVREIEKFASSYS